MGNKTIGYSDLFRQVTLGYLRLECFPPFLNSVSEFNITKTRHDITYGLETVVIVIVMVAEGVCS